MIAIVLMLVEIGTCTVAFVTSQIALNQYVILLLQIFLRLCNDVVLISYCYSLAHANIIST